MLIPLKTEAKEELIPVIATGNQYAFYWGNWQNLLKNLLISFIVLLFFWLVALIFGKAVQGLSLILRIIAGLYWLWGPIYWASVRNSTYRRYPYSAFWRGKILDVYITEELINEQATFNKLGDLIMMENRQKKINLEVGDKNGFRANIQAPLKRIHKSINPGQSVQGLVLSKDSYFNTIDTITDVYIPRLKLWLGEYPYLRRDVFLDVSRELAEIYGPKRRNR
jgi:hypothetical protein